MGCKSSVTSLRQQRERPSKKRPPCTYTWWHGEQGENFGMCSLASQSFPTHGGGSEQGLNAVLRVPGMMQCLWALPSCSPVALSHQGRMAEPRPAAELPGFIPFPPLTCRLLRAFQALQPCAHRGERSRKHLRCAGPCRLAPAPSASL